MANLEKMTAQYIDEGYSERQCCLRCGGQLYVVDGEAIDNHVDIGFD